MNQLIPVLATSWEQLVFIAILLLISGAGSAIGKLIKKKEQDASLSSEDESPEPRVSLDELSARRRAELAAEAQRRRAQQQASGEAPSRPLSMAERMKQARQQASGQSSAPPQRPPTADQVAIERRRRAEAAELERRRQAALREQQLRQQRARQQQSSHPRARQHQQPPAPPRRPAPPSRQPARPVAPTAKQPHYAREHDEVHRLLVSSPEPAAAPRIRPAGGFSLRQAMIWKEILDKPVGLRGADYDFPT